MSLLGSGSLIRVCGLYWKVIVSGAQVAPLLCPFAPVNFLANMSSVFQDFSEVLASDMLGKLVF